jgi:amino acid permease
MMMVMMMITVMMVMMMIKVMMVMMMMMLLITIMVGNEDHDHGDYGNDVDFYLSKHACMQSKHVPTSLGIVLCAI